MKNLVQVTRFIVGILFIFSGLIKANDPSGLAYKMDEYFAVWGWNWAADYTIGLSIAMNVFEIVSGVALLLGWLPKLNSRLLLLLIVFFTFLTGYAVFSGKIKTCGCFGDCIPLQAHQSFIKDLILLGLILILVKYHYYIKPVLPLRANLFLVLFSMGFAFWGQLNVLKHLPYIDCLPYAIGSNLLEKMQPPPGSIPDSVAVLYTYRVNGQTVSFDANSFPEDFDESKYEFVKRENKIVRKGSGVPPIQDLALITATGTDTTKALLSSGAPYLLFFAKDFDGSQPLWYDLFAKIVSQATEKQIPIFITTNQPANAQLFFNQTKNYKLPVLTCDGTVMKSMLRSKTGIIAMNGAIVKGKWAEEDMNDIVRFLNAGLIQ
jgi:uncharacterized membrane protein YphA (DoxX/SURF4 family)